MISRSIKPLKSNSFFLFGPRGSGKTSFLKGYFGRNAYLWVDLLDDEILDRYQVSPQLLRREIEALQTQGKAPEWVIIDEVQKAPKLLNVAHQLIESKNPIKFALTGSSARRLKQQGTNLLAGRAFVEHLFPFTHRELGDEFNLEQALTWGTLPKIFSLDDESKANYLRSYSLTYLKSEIQEEQWVKKIEPFRRFLPSAAQNNGMPLNFSKYARDIGVDVTTIQSYFEILDDTLMGFHLPSYSKSIRKQQRKAAKFYFFDVGIRRSLERKMSVALFPQTSDFGNCFEHWLITEVYKLNIYGKKEFELSYLLTKDNVEIDLILDRPNQKTALIEIKSTDRIDAKDLSSFVEISRSVKNSEAYVFSNDPRPQKIEKVLCLHWKEGLRAVGL